MRPLSFPSVTIKSASLAALSSQPDGFKYHLPLRIVNHMPNLARFSTVSFQYLHSGFGVGRRNNDTEAHAHIEDAVHLFSFHFSNILNQFEDGMRIRQSVDDE